MIKGIFEMQIACFVKKKKKKKEEEEFLPILIILVATMQQTFWLHIYGLQVYPSLILVIRECLLQREH